MNAIELGNQLEQQYEGNEDYNGYLDKGQTVIDFLTREHNCSLQEVLDNDPARVLKLWIKCYKQAHLGALLGTAIGAIGFMGGMAIGALPLSGIGAAAAVYSFLTARHHKDAIEFAEHEEMILNQLPGLLFFMADKERAGARTSALASKYNYMILECFANSNIDLRDPAYLKGFLEGDVQRDQIFNQYSPFPSSTPAIEPAPNPKKAIGPTTRLNAVEAAATRVLDDGSIPSWQPAVQTSVVPQDEVLREDYWGKGDEMGDLIDRAMAQAQQSLLAKSEAVETPPTQESIAPIMFSDAPTNVVTRKEPHPVDYLIGDRPRTSMIVAVSGGGKDFLLSNAVRAFAQKYPDFRIIIMDCKDDPKEYGYYEGIPNTTIYRMNVTDEASSVVAEWAEEALEDFRKTPEKCLLVCNEGTQVRAASEEYVSYITKITSSGDSRQKYVWEAGQGAHLKDLKIEAPARSRFRTLIIGLKSEELQVKAILNADFVMDSARNFNDLKMQIQRSPVSRAWSDCQRWYPMPTLTNYAGYDRDSRSFIA